MKRPKSSSSSTSLRGSRAHLVALFLCLIVLLPEVMVPAQARLITPPSSSSVIITDPVTQRRMPHKKVLVTGAAGFVGSHVADYLLARGDDVVIVDEVNDYYDVNIKESNLQMLQDKYNHNNATTKRLSIYRGDICNDEFIAHVMEMEQSFDAICHMAARAGVRPSILDPFIYVHSNIEGTVKLMELAVKYKVPNFVFASSSSVYGGSKSTFFSELERVDRPISPYAATKKSCELFSYVYSHLYDLNVTALRFFTVYGPRGRPDMAPFKFIDRVSRGAKIQQFGDGSSSRDYTYIDDIVQGVVRAVDTPTQYKILNLGKGSGTVLKDFLAMVEKYVGKKAVIEVLPDQPGDVPYTCANVTIAHNHLGYQPTVPFEEGIQRTVDWYKQAYPNAGGAQRETSDTSVAVHKNRSRQLRRRLERLIEQEVSIEDHQLLKTLQRILAEDTTTFEKEFDNEEGSMDLLFDEGYPSHRRLVASENDNKSWKLTAIVEPHRGYKKVLVTGGAGFIGSHVVDYLLSRGDDVVLVDDQSEDKEANLLYLQEKFGSAGSNSQSGKLAVYRGDICDAEFLGKIFEKEKPEWICHLASKNNESQSLADPVDYIRSNVEGTLQLLELSKGSDNGGHSIQNFVLASSASVYGTQAKRGEIASTTIVRTEDDRVDYPKSPFGASEKTAELLGFTYHHLYQIPVSALRLFHVYGPRYDADTELFQHIDRMFSGSDAAEFTDVGNIDYSYITDVVQGIVRSLDRPYGYEIFNIGRGGSSCKRTSSAALREFLELAVQAANVQGKAVDQVLDAKVASASNSVDGASCADISKAEHLLEYNASVSMKEGIQRTVTWHKQTYYPDLSVLSSDNANEDEDSRLKKLGENLPEESTVEAVLDTPTTIMSSSAPNLSIIKTAGEETFFLGFPDWFQRVAFFQWLLVVSILLFNTCFKGPFGLFTRGSVRSQSSPA